MSVSSKRKAPHWQPDWRNKPHDSYARLLLGDPRRARIFLRERLSPEIVSLLADAPPEVVSGDFVSKNFRHRRADVVLRVRTILKDVPVLYVLIEAKSRPDQDVARQVHEYHQDIWEYHERTVQSETGKKPNSRPPIVSIVLYNGQKPWTNVPRSYEEWLDRGRHPFLARPPGVRFILVNVNEIPTGKLSRDRLLRAGLALMQRPAIEKLEPVLGALSPNSDLIEPSVNYIYNVYPAEVRDRVAAMLPKLLNGKGEIVQTIADSYIQDGRIEGQVQGRAEGEARGIVKGRAQGRAEGEARGIVKGRAQGRAEGRTEGRAEGQAEMLIRQIRRRFGRVPRSVQDRVLRASRKQLVQWADEVIDAPSLKAMFGNARHS